MGEGREIPVGSQLTETTDPRKAPLAVPPAPAHPAKKLQEGVGKQQVLLGQETIAPLLF